MPQHPVTVNDVPRADLDLLVEIAAVLGECVVAVEGVELGKYVGAIVGGNTKGIIDGTTDSLLGEFVGVEEMGFEDEMTGSVLGEFVGEKDMGMVD